MPVQTTKGLVAREALELRDIISEDDNSRAIATEYYLDGELVRRDVAVSIFAGVSLSGEQNTIG